MPYEIFQKEGYPIAIVATEADVTPKLIEELTLLNNGDMRAKIVSGKKILVREVGTTKIIRQLRIDVHFDDEPPGS